MIKINSNHVVLDGLTKKEVEEARKKYGTNELSHKKQNSFSLSRF